MAARPACRCECLTAALMAPNGNRCGGGSGCCPAAFTGTVSVALALPLPDEVYCSGVELAAVVIATDSPAWSTTAQAMAVAVVVVVLTSIDTTTSVTGVVYDMINLSVCFVLVALLFRNEI